MDRRRYPRNTLARLRLAGYDWVKETVIAGSINNFMKFGYGLKVGLSSDEAQTIADKLEDGLRFAMGCVTDTTNGRRLLRRVELLVCFTRGYYSRRIPRDRLAEFISILASGVVNDGKHDSAAIRLRDFIVSLKTEKGKHMKHLLYGKAQRAMVAFAKGQNLQILKGAENELFPLSMDDDIKEIMVNVRTMTDITRRQMKNVKPWDVNSKGV